MRGTTQEVGAQRISKNGYLYEKTADGWVLVHRLLMQEKLGRKLKENEYVTFEDGDKTNVTITNLILRERGKTSIRRRVAQLEARIAELNAAKEELLGRLETQSKL